MTTITDRLAAALRDMCQRDPTDEALAVLAEYEKPPSKMDVDQLLVALATPSSVDEAADTLGRVYASEELVQVVRTLLSRLDRLGFKDPDASVSGGDCIELICELLPNLRRAVAEHSGQTDDVDSEDARERRRLSDFLICDWQNSFADNADETFGAVERVLRYGHTGYEQMSIEELRRQAEDAGYEDDLEDEPQGMSP